MSFQNFVGESGLKILAMAQLSAAEYALMLYLLNAAASGLDELLATEKDLAQTLGLAERELSLALETLRERSLVKIRENAVKRGKGSKSISIGLNDRMSQWRLKTTAKLSNAEALVFPFRGSKVKLVSKIDLPDKTRKTAPINENKKKLSTWQRVLDSFLSTRVLDKDQESHAHRDAQALVETHPVDQVLLMLRHFGHRIPTLSLLLSSWKHYQELYEQETMHVDLLEARQKHSALDEKLRADIAVLLDKAGELNLSDDERLVLELLSAHNYPRRQLFWAYQSRSRYPQLKDFFKRNTHHMLPVTTSGQIKRKKPHQDLKK